MTAGGGCENLFVVIPTHNRWEEARICLEHLRRSTLEGFRIVLVEDGCRDGTVENCRAAFPDVHLVHGDGSLWWGGAINAGTQYALERGAELVVWLNDDNRVERDTLAHLVAGHGRRGDRSIVGSRIRLLGSEGEEWRGRPGNWHPDYRTWTDPELAGDEIPLVHPPGGQGVLIPAGCFREVGVIDTRAFPHYWADHDFHYRAMGAGYRYSLSTRAVVWNVPNHRRPGLAEDFTPAWIRWFLFDRRSSMNIAILRRLMKRHLPPREYRATFYPLLLGTLGWLATGWINRHPSIHRSLRALRRAGGRSTGVME